MEETNFDPHLFPTTGILIAPYWGDADTTGTGTISYGVTTESAVLAKARGQIAAGFPAHSAFEPLYVFIATWDHVGYFLAKTDLVRNQ